ncbi:hypothetical protein KZ829_34630 [Actinoplanes hulinensis]|uniref:Lipoprotein n=1 Tax=Actinoplanes hulinensis TaxID=1144547 RepID=A0ABS7BE08_9ACTN|nr:hypothetical protein [Actinoplanes hulinensis]MBW6438879.1 hypothetical protein [Actinoplanes hulinensis]
MRFQRLTVVTVTIAALAGMGGCGSATTDSKPAATTQAAADPLAEFVAASKKLGTETMKMKMEMPGGIEASGVSDLAGKKVDMVMSVGAAGQTMEIAVRLVGDEMFMKYGATAGAKWWRLDVSKLPASSSMNPKNMADASAFAQAAVKVEKNGDTFSGTLDMTKSPTADPESLKALGDKASAVPFTAKVDGEGRLTELVIDMSSLGAGAGKMTTTYSDFGTPVSVEAPPAAEVTEMPAEMLKSLSQTA